MSGSTFYGYKLLGGADQRITLAAHPVSLSLWRRGQAWLAALRVLRAARPLRGSRLTFLAALRLLGAVACRSRTPSASRVSPLSSTGPARLPAACSSDFTHPVSRWYLRIGLGTREADWLRPLV